jgi:hypothetical protein
MRRILFVLLLLVVMPLQSVWASAADHCLQSSLQHDRLVATLAVDADGSAACTAHCAACHAGCLAAPLPSTHDARGVCASPFPTGLDAHFESHIPTGPERPDRSDLLLAA